MIAGEFQAHNLRGFPQFAQFKKREKHSRRNITFSKINRNTNIYIYIYIYIQKGTTNY